MAYDVIVKHWVRGERKPVVEEVAKFRDSYDAEPYAKWLAGDVHRQGPIGDRVEVIMLDSASVVQWSSGEIKVRG